MKTLTTSIESLNSTKKQFTVDELCRFIDAAMPKFMQEWEEGINNERKYLGNNYSAKDESDIKSQGRQSLSIPVIKTKLTNISGEQRKRRTSFKIESSVDPNDEIKAELATLQVKAVERRSKFKYLESDVFDFGTGVKYAGTKMALETRDYFKRVIVKRLDYMDFIWDRNNKQYDLNEDALWTCDIERMPRIYLEKLEGINTQGITEGSHNNFSGREMTSYYVVGSGQSRDYDIISVYNFYIKQPRRVYCVLFPDSQDLFGESVIIQKFTSKKEADRKLRELQVEYVLNGFAPEGVVEAKYEKRIDYYRFVYNALIKYEQTDYEMFPHNLFRAIWCEDNYASMMDFLKDPQKVIDRMWMQIDFSIGKSLKNVYMIVDELLSEKNTPEQARKILQKTGGVVGVKTLREKAIEELTSQGANPQWFQIIDLMLGYLEDLAGGVNFQGGAIGSNQSGISQRILANEGQKLAVPLLDNLSRWKEGVGRNILWWLQHYETAEDVIRVQGGALSPEMIQLLQENGIYTSSPFKKDGSGYLRINQEGNELSYLKDANFELIVTEAEMSETDKQMKYIQYKDAEQSDPMLLQSSTFQEKKLELLGLPVSDTKMIIAERQQVAQEQAKMAQEELNLRKAEILLKDKQGLMQQMSQDKQLEANKKEKK